ncbi:CPBP family intramembrane glutamic endopeptidase [Lunatibacter salilacus]|uniref:CPBP family intramembrane glutamic endopeptidase n=1 Tax=Lunatibacter salilacus TaxID=2483804 RepID=UPI00131D271C|nr:CPBP family intramembrane glutamic endopeptidase [Lunatibacter salilacus]
MKPYIPIRNLVIFSLVALAIGWIGVWLDSQIPDQEEEETLGMALWLTAPLIVVILLRTFFGDGWKDAGLKPNFTGNLHWYAIAFLIFPVVTIISLSLGAASGWMDFSGFDSGSYLSVFVSLFVVNIVKNIFEESVWRGYLTAKLIRLNLSDLSIYLIAGLVWGLWHLPYYMEFLPEEAMYTVLPVSRLWFAVIAIGNMVVWTIMFTELFRLTGSVWVVVLLHAVEDAVINHLIIDGYVVISAGKEILISPICGIIPTVIYLLIGLLLRQQRIQQQKTQSSDREASS